MKKVIVIFSLFLLITSSYGQDPEPQEEAPQNSTYQESTPEEKKYHSCVAHGTVTEINHTRACLLSVGALKQERNGDSIQEILDPDKADPCFKAITRGLEALLKNCKTYLQP